MNRVVVTGASGFIGRHALRPLVERGYDVHAVARRPPPNLIDLGVEWHAADLLDHVATGALLQRLAPTHLLHLAWYAEHGKFWTAPENLDWVAASLRLIRQFAAAGGRRAVLAGSCAEYDWTGGLCSEAATPLRPHTLYGVAKNAAAAVTAAAAPVLGLSIAWGRIFFVFGPHEDPRRLVASVIVHLLRGEVAPISHGRQRRDFLPSPQVASAFTALLSSEVEGPVNIGSGVPVSILDIARRAGELVGRPELVRPGALTAAPDDPPLIVADVTRLEQEVGWRAELELDAGLQATIEWWRSLLGSEPAPAMYGGS